jgi:tripartite-type tricarboxylate transporter receptor subunit TctC
MNTLLNRSLSWVGPVARAAARWTIVVAGAFAGAAAASDDYPYQPIRLIVPGPPGVGVDLDARPIAQKMAELLRQPIMIENRPGAGGIIALEATAKAAPDGYTLVFVGTPFAVLPFLHRKLPYDPDRDFVPISLTQRLPMVLTVPPSIGASSVQELIAMAKARPGTITFASQGHGSFPHLAGELFKAATGADLKHVPYSAQNPLSDLAGGRVMAMFSGIAPVIGSVNAGKLKVLAVSSRERVAVIGDVPTFIEAGVPGYDATVWNGLLAPRGTPAAIVARVNAAAAKAVHSPQVKERMLRFGGVPVGSSPEEFDALIRTERARWGKLIQDAKLQLE